MKGAPKGNQFAKGNPGGGRKSAYKEQKEAVYLRDKWQNDVLVFELQAKIDSGKYSIRDMFVLKALQGNEKVLQICANKIIPDLHDVSSLGAPIAGIVYLPKRDDPTDTDPVEATTEASDCASEA